MKCQAKTQKKEKNPKKGQTGLNRPLKMTNFGLLSGKTPNSPLFPANC
jgi:hypothetical protein